MPQCKKRDRWKRKTTQLVIVYLYLSLYTILCYNDNSFQVKGNRTDGEVKKSKVRSIMKHFVRHISAAINRSASRNIFLKTTKTLNLIRHIQQNSSSSPSFDSISSSSSHSPDEFLQEFELQISNQDVIQT